ncbi:MAG: AAA family ATPase [Phycisphaerales bacterium]|nr:AAA family ATPase [Phycisphaerales bacterium]
MAKKPTAIAQPVATGAASAVLPVAPVPRPRLHKLRISNFRSIGSTPVEIELDDIVVLVGPNNAGKSSILRAYQVAMEHGSAEGKLTIDDFPNGKVDPLCLPTIELETVVFDKTAPGDKWIRTDTQSNEMFVRERWTWAEPGAPKKVGWDVAANDWHASEGPWGAANVAQAYRPKPHRVTAFHNPTDQAAQIVGVLKEALTAKVKAAKAKPAGGATGGTATEYEKLLESIKALQKSIASEATSAVDEMRTDLGKIIGEVFPGYAVTFDARPEDDIDKTISLFKADPLLRMGPSNGHQTTLDRQGSGACRTLLWAALRILADRTDGKSATASDRPNLLLMDEPELCLHPDAIRQACSVLYDLPKTNNWQVMITTHSPVFIDFSRDNTSIVRVERVMGGAVQGTTIYRPKRAKLDDDDKAELKLLNLCDPYVAEFFFGGRTIVVEGDTEYTAFKHVISNDAGKYKGIHIVRARSKACVSSLCKVLNQFDKGYAVLHDSDHEKIIGKKSKKERNNSAWTENGKILAATEEGRKAGKVRLVASVPNLEEGFFGEASDGEKPYSALIKLRKSDAAFEAIASLLDALIDPAKPVPTGAIEWSDLNSLAAAVKAFDDAQV